MKKIIAFALVLVLLFSGCGWNVKIVDPTEKQDFEEKTSFPEEVPEKISGERATFRLGPEGESRELYPGDKLGGWVLEKFEKDSEGIDSVFCGKITLECSVALSPMASDEPVYVFTVAEEYLPEMPFYFGDERTDFRFRQDSGSNGIEVLENLEPGEEINCMVKISRLNYLCLPMSVYSSAVIEEITVNP